MSHLPQLFWRRLAARVLFLPTLGWNLLLGRVLRVRHWWDAIDDACLHGRTAVAPRRPRTPAARRGSCRQHVRGIRRAGRGLQPGRHRAAAHSDRGFHTAHAGECPGRPWRSCSSRSALGRRVYVHCKAGRARSGTVVLCWLIAAHGMTPAEAQQRILQRRPHANPRLAQRAVVQEFWQQFQARAQCPRGFACARRHGVITRPRSPQSHLSRRLARRKTRWACSSATPSCSTSCQRVVEVEAGATAGGQPQAFVQRHRAVVSRHESPRRADP